MKLNKTTIILLVILLIILAFLIYFYFIKGEVLFGPSLLYGKLCKINQLTQQCVDNGCHEAEGYCDEKCRCVLPAPPPPG